MRAGSPWAAHVPPEHGRCDPGLLEQYRDAQSSDVGMVDQFRDAVGRGCIVGKDLGYRHRVCERARGLPERCGADNHVGTANTAPDLEPHFMRRQQRTAAEEVRQGDAQVYDDAPTMVSPQGQHQLSAQVATFTDPVRRRDIRQRVERNWRRLHRARLDKRDHTLQMHPVARYGRA